MIIENKVTPIDIMFRIENRVSKKECLRYWNKDRMTDADFEQWWFRNVTWFKNVTRSKAREGFE